MLRARIGPRANAARVAVVEGPRSSRARGELDPGAAAEAVLGFTGSWGAATSAVLAFARSGERVLAWADWMLD